MYTKASFWFREDGDFQSMRNMASYLAACFRNSQSLGLHLSSCVAVLQCH